MNEVEYCLQCPIFLPLIKQLLTFFIYEHTQLPPVGFRKSRQRYWAYGKARQSNWCVVKHEKVTATFCFAEDTITSTCYFDMLELYSAIQIKELSPRISFHEEETPPHESSNFTKFLDRIFLRKMTGRSEAIVWTPWSPELTSTYVFHCGAHKGSGRCSPQRSLL